MLQLRDHPTLATTDDRRRYNAHIVLPHPQLEEVRNGLSRVVEHNSATATGRQFLGVTGPFGSGKSGILEEIILDLWESTLMGREPIDETGANRISVQPTFYADANSSGEADLAEALTYSLGLPAVTSNGDTAARRLRRAKDACQRNRCEYGFVDDVNMMNSSSRKTHLTQFCKQMGNLLPVTLIFCGKDLYNTPAFSPRSGSTVDSDAADQLRLRLVGVEIVAIPSTKNGIATFTALVHDVISHMMLRDSDPIKDLGGDGLATLYSASGGLVGKVFNHLRYAASSAVGADEKVTPALIEESIKRFPPEIDRK